MKTSILALSAFLATANGFSARAPFAARRTRRAFPQLRMAADDAQDEVAALRAAAAKAREDAARLSEELGKPLEPEAATVVAKGSVSMEDIQSVVSSIDFEGGDAVSQTMSLNKGVENGDLSLWKSTNLRTFPVSLQMLEQRSGGKVTGESLGVTGEDDVNLDDFKYATLWVTGGSTVAAIFSLAVLPPNIGATLCYFFALIPVIFLGIGSSAPRIIAGAIASTRGTADTEEEKMDRICRHEAGHFLAGYACGLPIKGYSLLDSGIPCVEFHPSSEGDTGREFTADEVAALSVVAMSGSVAEALELGTAKGGENDLLELDGLLRRSQDFVGAQKQQDLTRWGALTAYQILKANEEKYEALVEAFKNKKSVAECVAIIESR